MFSRCFQKQEVQYFSFAFLPCSVVCNFVGSGRLPVYRLQKQLKDYVLDISPENLVELKLT